MIEPGRVSRIASTTSSWPRIRCRFPCSAARRAASAPLVRSAAGTRQRPAASARNASGCRPGCDTSPAGGQLVGIDVDAHQILRHVQAADGVEVEIGLPEFGADADHQVCGGDQLRGRLHGSGSPARRGVAREGREPLAVSTTGAARPLGPLCSSFPACLAPPPARINGRASKPVARCAASAMGARAPAADGASHRHREQPARPKPPCP